MNSPSLASLKPPIQTREWRNNTIKMLKDKESSQLALILDYFFLFALVLSICTLCAQTVQSVYSRPELKLVLFWIDAATIIVFTLEFILNCLALEKWKDILRWTVRHSFCYYILFFSSSTIVPLSHSHRQYLIDIVAVLPFYIELIVNAAMGKEAVDRGLASGLGAIRVLRIFRAARLFKAFQRSSKLRILGHALKDARDGIPPSSCLHVYEEH